MASTEFRSEWFVPQLGSIGGSPEDVVITVPLQPFSIDGAEVSTTVYLENFALPIKSFLELPGRTFTFPLNPEDGYIDASVYIRNVHNPIDVSRISFGSFAADVLEARISGLVAFTYENSGFADFPFEVTVNLAVPPN